MDFDDLLKAVLELNFREREKLLAEVSESIRKDALDSTDYQQIIDNLYFNSMNALREIPGAKESYLFASHRFKSLDLIEEETVRALYDEVCKAYEVLNERIDYARYAIRSDLPELLRLVNRIHRSEYKDKFVRQTGGRRFDEDGKEIEVFPWWNDLSAIRLKANECSKLAKRELTLYGNVTVLYHYLNELFCSQGANVNNDQATGMNYSLFEDKTLSPNMIYKPKFE